ncbi:hypothetical protein D9M70_473330 [compost metagenome]
MVAHIGQADARGDAAMPRAGRQQDGLGHAIGLARGQGVAGLQGFRIAAEHVGVVADLVTHRTVQADSLVGGIGARAAVPFGELDHQGVVTINEAAGFQVALHGGSSSGHRPSL